MRMDRENTIAQVGPHVPRLWSAVCKEVCRLCSAYDIAHGSGRDRSSLLGFALADADGLILHAAVRLVRIPPENACVVLFFVMNSPPYQGNASARSVRSLRQHKFFQRKRAASRTQPSDMSASISTDIRHDDLVLQDMWEVLFKVSAYIDESFEGSTNCEAGR